MLFDYLKGLNQDQLKAVKYPLSLNVLAGAGTGKTKCLVSRVLYLIHDVNISDKKILIISFNVNAVKEIKHRLNHDVKIMTFHGLSTLILKKHIALLPMPYTKDFKIIDSFKAEDIIKHLLRKNDLEAYRHLALDLHYAISKIKKKMFTKKKSQRFKKFFKIYNDYLINHNLMDFDDLNIYSTQVLLTNSNLLKSYQNQYQYVLIDEYQDIDFYHFQMINLLAAHSVLFIVGDPFQNIYRFRGSDNNYFELIKDKFKMKTIELKINYRSHPSIIKRANLLIKNNYPLIPYRKDQGDHLFYCPFYSYHSEQAFIINKIKELKHKHNYKYADFVILYRNNYLFHHLAEMFKNNNLPYEFKEDPIRIKGTKGTKVLQLDNDFLPHLKPAKREEIFKLLTVYKMPDDKIIISSIHAVKGIEFKAVFIIGFEEEIFLDSLIHCHDEAEEKRLSYVAITRAIDYCFITSCAKRFYAGKEHDLKPLRFLKNMNLMK